jgi:hypothetical protein
LRLFCALVCAGLAVNAAHDLRWWLFGFWAVVMLICFGLAFWAAVRAMPPMGKA